ncbi:MAG: uroporphyrinogen decarboxylase family protein [Armatimonadota bacterium]
MTHRERIETAWNHEEPDRVPIEFPVSAFVRDDPRCERLLRLAEEHADNFAGVPGYDWGFLLHPAERTERVLEDTGDYERIEWTMHTPAGEFVAVIRRPRFDTGIEDYHWEERYIEEPEDLERLLSVPFEPRAPHRDAFEQSMAALGDSAMPVIGLHHPLGKLVRSSNLVNVYSWLRTEPDLIHRYLHASNDYVIGAVHAMFDEGIGPNFISYAHEMLVPPWMGPETFDEFVFPYDSAVYGAIHERGGRFRAHCHGNCMTMLERFAEMGIDSVEPLEPPPYADVDLAEAKRLVGDRMLLSGNIPSQAFVFMEPEEVEGLVREAIEIAAPGGGFTLRLTGGGGGRGSERTEEQGARNIACAEAYFDAALKHGWY